MGFKKPHITVIVGLVTSGIALLFQVIAVAVTGWVKNKDFDITAGLWKVCLLNVCQDLATTSETDWLDATRAFSLLGLFFIVGALAAGILIMFIDNKFMAFIAGAVAIVAALFLMISFAIYADKGKSLLPAKLFTRFGLEVTCELSHCFALTVVAFVLCFASGVSFILSNFLLGASIASSTG